MSKRAKEPTELEKFFLERANTVWHMSFVAVGDDGKPWKVPRLRVETELEKLHHIEGQRVREAIMHRRQHQQ
jgi:acyl-CoA hydrolase